ncbi:MAG: 2-C-methyl-D-erythritol 4-phosphate cytidylyltransferase [Rubrivivax sp.]|nr:2-C-methyl-D-erythritol 4-phosphate cytidylyltransferase [Rubrivivax sp.]MDH5339305.1 2-C-methyl-D-erythritol 4-phosphate cytidylyltransferase [Rubrivivax sp.]
MRCFALVPCAGIGQRAGTEGPKQYALLAGRPLVAHTLAALAAVPRLAATLVVLAPGDTQFARLTEPHERLWVDDHGGATRAETVRAGLRALRARDVRDDDWVLVHDAARCLLQPSWVDTLIDACGSDDVGGLLALPLADTLKQADTSNRVAATIDRSGKWVAQTPQMFRLALLERALEAADGTVTDEAGAVEQLGLAPRLVPGALENFKLTWPGDFALAARLLETR